MSWIHEIDEAHADGALAQIYERLLRERGKVANILKVHSLNPGAMDAHLTLYMNIMFQRSGLSRYEREAIAVTVSAANDCDYCVTHHAESLRRYEKDETVVERIASADYAELPERLTAMLLFATALTRYPGESREAHVRSLREAGLDDGEILDATLVVAYFNFVNRIALGLGVEFTDDEVSGYKV
jgi:uncharacterized peroxidase-related enzyme